MPVKIVYIGPLRSPLDERGDVEIAETEQWARAGEPIEVDDDIAGHQPLAPVGSPDDEDYDPGDAGSGLLAQTSNWIEAGAVPDASGSVASILAEVGDDPAKAAAALALEQARGDKARSTLVTQLEAIAKEDK